jgi:transcriptional regulator with XRE-family HTH domain
MEAFKSNMIRLKASNFEILKNARQSSGDSKQQLCGYLGIDDEATFEALRELCNNAKIEKVIVIYHDYAFSLLGVSFSEDAESDNLETKPNTYKFQASDVHLEALAAYKSN